MVKHVEWRTDRTGRTQRRHIGSDKQPVEAKPIDVKAAASQPIDPFSRAGVADEKLTAARDAGTLSPGVEDRRPLVKGRLPMDVEDDLNDRLKRLADRSPFAGRVPTIYAAYSPARNDQSVGVGIEVDGGMGFYQLDNVPTDEEIVEMVSIRDTAEYLVANARPSRRCNFEYVIDEKGKMLV